MMKKVACLFIGMIFFLVTGCHEEDRLLNQTWQEFRQRYVTADGRVIDDANGGISHSESQGIGLLVAQTVNDRETFDLMWRWTQTHLQVREDRLFAWRWTPAEATPMVGKAHVDENNASDGDILIAWALLRASDQWYDKAYKKAAVEIIQDIRLKLIRPSPRGTVLLPGSRGFQKPDGIMTNLSYIVFPAIQDFQKVDKNAYWSQLYRDTIALLKKTQFGAWRLPPDWLFISAEGDFSPTRNQRFGYDAIRIPLYLIWAGEKSPELFIPYLDFWQNNQDPLRSWVSLEDGELAHYPAEPGMVAVMNLVNETFSGPSLTAKNDSQTRHYYSDALQLLTMIAAKERKGS